jgi:hypothetical protein
MKEETLSDICRSLSKSGQLSAYRAELEAYASTADQPQVLELYDFLRDNSERFAAEWREEFESIFSHHKDALPDLDDDEEWGDILHSFVEAGDLNKIRQFFARIGIEGWPLPPGDDFDLYPIEAEDDECERPIEKAKRLGHNDIALYLEQVLNKYKN